MSISEKSSKNFLILLMDVPGRISRNQNWRNYVVNWILQISISDYHRAVLSLGFYSQFWIVIPSSSQHDAGQATQAHFRIPRGFSKCQEMLAVVVERTLSESVFYIASGQYAKSKFDWQQETPTQRSAALSTAQSLHSGTLPRLHTSGFQMLYHLFCSPKGCVNHFPPFVKKTQKQKHLMQICKNPQQVANYCNNLKQRLIFNGKFTNWYAKLVKFLHCFMVMIWYFTFNLSSSKFQYHYWNFSIWNSHLLQLYDLFPI